MDEGMIGIDGRYVQDHFPGIGRYTYNLVRALAEEAPNQPFCLLPNPRLRNTRYDIGALTQYPNVHLQPLPVPTMPLAEQSHLLFAIRNPVLSEAEGSQFALLHFPYYIRLVEAWALLRSHFAPRTSPLGVAGAWDPRYPQVKARVAELGLQDSVVFLGPMPDEDLPDLYSGATLFAFPSLYEGFGLPALEAMACGTPVITSNASSLPEVVGGAGIVVEPRDLRALAEAMERALTDEHLRAELRAKGLERAKRFRWERAARETFRVYRQVVARCPKCV